MAEPEDEPTCGICFTAIDAKENPQGALSSCAHIFCAFCISAWAEHTNVCPQCKQRFSRINTLGGADGKTVVESKKIRRKNFRYYEEEDSSDDEEVDAEGNVWQSAGTLRASTILCRVCGLSDQLASMLLCDRRTCDYTAHYRCVGLSEPPFRWLCDQCKGGADPDVEIVANAELPRALDVAVVVDADEAPVVQPEAPPSAPRGRRRARPQEAQVVPAEAGESRRGRGRQPPLPGGGPVAPAARPPVEVQPIAPPAMLTMKRPANLASMPPPQPIENALPSASAYFGESPSSLETFNVLSTERRRPGPSMPGGSQDSTLAVNRQGSIVNGILLPRSLRNDREPSSASVNFSSSPAVRLPFPSPAFRGNYGTVIAPANFGPIEPRPLAETMELQRTTGLEELKRRQGVRQRDSASKKTLQQKKSLQQLRSAGKTKKQSDITDATPTDLLRAEMKPSLGKYGTPAHRAAAALGGVAVANAPSSMLELAQRAANSQSQGLEPFSIHYDSVDSSQLLPSSANNGDQSGQTVAELTSSPLFYQQEKERHYQKALKGFQQDAEASFRASAYNHYFARAGARAQQDTKRAEEYRETLFKEATTKAKQAAEIHVAKLKSAQEQQLQRERARKAIQEAVAFQKLRELIRAEHLQPVNQPRLKRDVKEEEIPDAI